jgi:hypothetical protein
LNTGLDETFQQSFREEINRQNLLIPDFQKVGDRFTTPTKGAGLQLSSRSSTRTGTSLRSPREGRTDRSQEIQEIKRQTFLEESPSAFDKKQFAANEKPPSTFEQLNEQGFEIKKIEEEGMITHELLKVGRGLLDMSQLVRDSVTALRTSKKEDMERLIPALNSRIDCGRERIDDSKKRLGNFKVSLD